MFKKIKFDNFIVGLIFGALFSLLVNIVTVKIQETVNKQRALEAVERELIDHLLLTNSIVSDEKVYNGLNETRIIPADVTMNKRFSTHVWDSTQINNYLFELDPNVAADLETYYEIIVKGYNKMLDENDAYYSKLFEPCKPFYTILTNLKAKDASYCNVIASQSINTHAKIASNIIKYIGPLKKSFHPTKDRLHNWWLKLLLGNKTVKILE